MKTLSATWQNFKLHPDVWFFSGFLITSVLSVRKVLTFYPINGVFNEYTGIYLYISDILLVLTLASWLTTVLYNNKLNLSSISTWFRKMFHACPVNCSTLAPKDVPRGTSLLGWNNLTGVEQLPVLLVLVAFISIFWATNKNLALFRSLKLAEFYALYLYIIRNVPHGTFLKRMTQIIIGLGIFESILGIWQFIVQHSIGLTWLRESLISQEIPGVAKLIIDGHKIIRAYGTFPHPNILGGFLLISIVLTWQYKKLFHACPVGCSTWNIPSGAKQTKCLKLKTWLILTILFLALILTFSKSAWIGLAIAALYIIYSTVSRLPRRMFHACPVGQNCSTWNNSVPSGVEQFGFLRGGTFWRKAILIIAIFAVLALIIKPDTNSLLFKSLNERIIFIKATPVGTCFTPARPEFVPRGTNVGGWNNFGCDIRTLAFGLGNGQFVTSMQKYSNQVLEIWQHQPVHNVFLLICSELGIAGLGLFIWLLWKMFHPSQIVPPQKEQNCSTPEGMFHVEHPTGQAWNVLRGTRGTFDGASVEQYQNSINAVFKGILLGFTFIMLFDHYFWDIQQGQIMLWTVMGLIAARPDSNIN